MCQGLWSPKNESKNISVAIKVLRTDCLSPFTDLRHKAGIWVSVDNENCVSILAICATLSVRAICTGVSMKIITPLLPLGCLRDYILKERENINSQVMLDWCTQIARVGDSS